MSAPGDAELAAVLEGDGRRVARLARRPSPYRTSFPLEEVDAEFVDGTALALVLKDLSRGGLSPEVRAVKPAFLHDPAREVEVYRRVLGPAGLGARCYGAVADGERGWLLLERVAGRELYQVGDPALWHDAARWLAALHARFASAGPSAPLLRHDAAYYRRWLDRAVLFLRDAPLPAGQRRGLARLAERHDRLIDRLTALPVTLLHGEFYASNVLVQESAGGTRVWPIDWEMAAVGPGLMDLAALTAGRWGEEDRRALERAYAPGSGLDGLDHCRLQVAVQWLGWAPGWSPPRERAHDWLGEALSLAERLLD